MRGYTMLSSKFNISVKLIFLYFPLLVLLTSCDNFNSVQKNVWNQEYELAKTLPNAPMLSRILLNNFDKIDAFQLLIKQRPIIKIGENAIFDANYCNNVLVSFFNVNGQAGLVDFSKLNEIFLDAPDTEVMGTRYSKEILNNSNFATFGSVVNWSFKYPNKEVITESISVPYGFSNVRLESNSFSINNGGVIVWDNSDNQEQLFITAQWAVSDSSGQNSQSELLYLKSIFNNGRLVISSDDMRAMNIPNAEHKMLLIGISKGNYKINDFGNPGKLVTICYIYQPIQININN